MDTDKAAFVIPFLNCPDCLFSDHLMVYLERQEGGVYKCPDCGYSHSPAKSAPKGA